ncbi:MAG: cupredoxin domain-containing protein [Chlorobiaceae bacterium]
MKQIPFVIIALCTFASPTASAAATKDAQGQAQNSSVKTFTILYSNSKKIAPNTFTVKTGERVRLEVQPLDTATGCMNTIMVPGLWDKPEPIIKGKKIVMEFTPLHPGSYKITCAMGVNQGVINVK